MRKIRSEWVRKQILKRLFYPANILKMIRLAKSEKERGRSGKDAQLQLYARILEGDFLHYGYFDDPDKRAESISLDDFYAAQLRYGEKLLERISCTGGPVLDIGCGMGGLMHLLRNHGCDVSGLTPDRFQVAYITDKYPDYRIIHSTLERMDAEAYSSAFSTVINSESLQYIKLDKGLPVIDKILRKDGKWVISDYFRVTDAFEKSGLNWDWFRQKLSAYGMKITYEEDITSHIRPTLAFLHMWGTRFGLPLFEFLTGKLERKKRILNFIVQDVIAESRLYITDHLKLVDPDQFAREKRYVILVVERDAKGNH